MTYCEFPEGEYLRRYEHLTAEGRRSNIKAFIFSDELNIRYFAGGPLTDIWVCRNDFVILIIPTDPKQQPVLLLNKARQGAARSSWIEDQRYWTASIDAPERNEAFQKIIQALREKRITEGTVAMETGMNETLFMPIMLYDEIKATFPKLVIDSAHRYVIEVQAIKSQEEIDALRLACEISTNAFEKGFEALREGRTEKEISGVVKSEMLRMGAESVPFLTVIAGWDGRSICCDSHATDYQIKNGDIIQFDGGCAVKGYCADMCRTGALGHVGNPRYLELYEASKQAHCRIRSELRDGARIRDVCAAGRDYFVKHDFKDLMVFGEGQTGHGIGMDLHQPPFLLYDSNEILREGMVLAIEPALSECPKWDESSYFTILENNYVITTDGCEQLTNSDEDIRIV